MRNKNMKKALNKTALALLASLTLSLSANAGIKKIPEEYSDNDQAETAKIFYTAAVEPKLVSDLVFAIDDLNINYPHLKRIYLYINSDGGDMDGGQIAYWAVKSSKIPITTVNLSMVGSSASIIFCGAKERLSLPGGKFLLHASSLTGSEGLLRPDDIDNLKKSRPCTIKCFLIPTNSVPVIPIRKSVNFYTAKAPACCLPPMK